MQGTCCAGTYLNNGKGYHTVDCLSYDTGIHPEVLLFYMPRSIGLTQNVVTAGKVLVTDRKSESVSQVESYQFQN